MFKILKNNHNKLLILILIVLIFKVKIVLSVTIKAKKIYKTLTLIIFQAFIRITIIG